MANLYLKSDNHPGLYPNVWLYKDSVSYFSERIQHSGTLGGIFVNGIYEIRLHNVQSTIQDFYITIEITQV